MDNKIESSKPLHPLAEVFGFPVTNYTKDAERFRRNKLCPFNNRVPSCTKDKAKNPLGVCSIFDDGKPVITCPVRFRENWIIVEQASEFFFKKGTLWTSIAEVRLDDKNGKSAGNIDIILVAYNEQGKITDFGSLEVQAVYISGNIRTPFEHYMSNSENRQTFKWVGKPNYPKPDYLSSSRKRLIPQVLYKGGIFKTWHKKQAVALQKGFFETLPEMPRANRKDADLAWFLYDIVLDKTENRYRLVNEEIVYTKFEPAMKRIIDPEPGQVEEFIELLQEKLDEKLDGNPPDAPTLTDTVLQQ